MKEKNKYILAIDPGNIESAYCLIEIDTYKPVCFDKVDNDTLINVLKWQNYAFDKVIIEKIASYGMAVGETTFDTCIWIGRFKQIALDCKKDVEYIYRREEKMNLCYTMKAKDSNIRQALIDRFGIVGTKKDKGFFYGFKKDIWSAYAVGITYLDKSKKG